MLNITSKHGTPQAIVGSHAYVTTMSAADSKGNAYYNYYGSQNNYG